ncbi:MAG: efflux RND transporter periplasmic adaptor subunit [Terracidiphilus sp.]
MAAARTQTNRWRLWAGAAVVLIAVFLVARYYLRERLPVRTAQVVRATLQNTLSTNGRVEPVVDYQFSSPIGTTVKAVYVHEGDQVRAGKLLITLDDVQAKAQVAAAESGLKTAQAAYYAVTHNGSQAEQQADAATVEQDRLARDQAQHNLDALTQLAATGAAASGEVAAAREQLQTAEANLTAAQKAAQGRYGQVDVARAQATLADAEAALAAAKHVEEQTSFFAPIAGTVFNLDATPTAYAEGGKSLLEIADLHHERVRAYFDEPDIGRLAVGQKVVIHWEAKPGREWHGHVAQLPAAIVAYGTRNVGEVLVDFDDSDDGLLPDTNVTLTVTISSEANALSMTREALHEQEGKYFVFKVVNGELKRVPVTIGAPNLTEVPILSGLEDGDVVATGSTNGQPLQEGIPIKEQQ